MPAENANDCPCDTKRSMKIAMIGNSAASTMFMFRRGSTIQ